MASKAFFDPIVLLRAAPLVSSTTALWFSVDQFTFLNNFLRPEHRDEANSLVPSYFKGFFPGGLARILLIYSISITTGAVNFRAKPNGAWRWYAAGTALAALHFAFVPKISKSTSSSGLRASIRLCTVEISIRIQDQCE